MDEKRQLRTKLIEIAKAGGHSIDHFSDGQIVETARCSKCQAVGLIYLYLGQISPDALALPCHPVETVYFTPLEYKTWTKLLRRKTACAEFGHADTIDKKTIAFYNGWEVDVKLVNSEDGPYLDIVLFHHGTEVTCAEPMFAIPMEITLKFENENFNLLFVERLL